MEAEVKTRLLASMNAGRLLIVCGAGLSMAAPSRLPSAKVIAERCFDKYRLESDPEADIALRGDLEALAEHFAGMNTLKSVFIVHLVPWKDFVRPPNPGHAAVADFLITRAASAGVSGNYDTLIERLAWSYGADFRGALDGDEAIVDAVKRSPLLKFHGCENRDRLSTVWATSQLQDALISERIEKSKTWMSANLRQKDLLVIGFWSDWDYLNAIIGSALTDVDPLSVTVVDPSPTASLEQKAPDLWAIAHADNVIFTHVAESGADVLDELRRAFSQSYIRQVLDAGRAIFEEATGKVCEADWLAAPAFDSETLYGWRRDAEGVPATGPATRIHPEQAQALGYFHLRLRDAGAIAAPEGYSLNGKTIRVVNGAGAALSSIRSQFVEPPSASTADIVVAVGAMDLGVPANVVRTGRVDDIIRPEGGGTWFDLDGGLKELEI